MAKYKQNGNSKGKVLIECSNCRKRELFMFAALDFWTCYCGSTDYKIIQ